MPPSTSSLSARCSRSNDYRLVSGGSDASVKLWDLEQGKECPRSHIFKPIRTVRQSAQAHKFGITHLSFYPFDSAAFISSSYDQTLKLWSTEEARLSASFPLGSKLYTHALSPIASHLLVACGTQHPSVRLACCCAAMRRRRKPRPQTSTPRSCRE